jgi:hypothetical protein
VNLYARTTCKNPEISDTGKGTYSSLTDKPEFLFHTRGKKYDEVSPFRENLTNVGNKIHSLAVNLIKAPRALEIN